MSIRSFLAYASLAVMAILIGATVHNPYFALVSALLSRSLVCELKALKQDELLDVLKAALDDKTRGLGNLKIKMEKKAFSVGSFKLIKSTLTPKGPVYEVLEEFKAV